VTLARANWVRYLPLGLLLIGPLAATVVGALLPPPEAHWSDHVVSASVAGGTLIAVAIGTWTVRARLGLLPVLILVCLVLGLGLETVGNIMAGQSIWREPYGDEDVWAAAQGVPGFEVGHDLAGWGDGLVVVSGVALAVYAGVRHWVSAVAAVAGTVLAFFPPWILPAVGAVLLLACTVIRQSSASGVPSRARLTAR
jgi:hypothetical protein